ncbi:MAG: tetratricopeptide repeat protein [Planctomycetes bacterium]|nr:tetratricopeptide repeat protein [Planctomycetota bacterium]
MTGAEQAYLFRHALLRDAAYGLQLPAERALLHECAVESFLALHEQVPDAAVAEVAVHAGMALALGRDTPALRDARRTFLMRAMEAAAAGFRLQETIARADEVVALDWITPEDRLSALVSAAEYSDRSGQRERARGYIETALSLLETHPIRKRLFQVRMLQAAVHIHLGRYAVAAESLRAVVNMGQREVGMQQYAVALGNLAIVHVEIGNYAEAEREYRQVVTLLRETGDRGEEGRTLGNLANLLRDQGKHEEAQGMYVRALQLLRQANDPYLEGIVLSNQAEQMVQLGRYQLARRAVAAVQALHARTGDDGGLAQANVHLAAAQAGEGDLAQAIDTARGAVAGLQRAESPLLAAIARYSLARILMQAELLDEAAQQARQAEQELEAMGARGAQLCQATPLRIRLALMGVATGFSMRELEQQLQACEAEVIRLGLGPDSQGAANVGECRRLLDAVTNEGSA